MADKWSVDGADNPKDDPGMRKTLKWTGIAIAAAFLLVIGATIGDSGNETTKNSAASREGSPPAQTQAPDATEEDPTPEVTPPPAPEPDATYKYNCDYLLGDFGESGDPAQGYRFVGGGNVRNTGNIGITVRSTFRWQLLGAAPVTEKRTTRVPVGKGRRVSVTIPVSQDQIDLHQSADGDCSAKATIVGTFGPTRD